MPVPSPLYLIDLLGVAVFAISGALAAGRKSLDLLGVVVIATVTAIGGGTLRDLLIDRHPVFWMKDTIYLWVILAATLFTLIYVRYRPAPLRALLVADALGLAMAVIGGAQVAQDYGYRGIVVVILGTMSGTAGGMVRDILTAEIPLILRNRQIYATAAILGISAYLILEAAGLNRQIASYIGMALVAGIRFAAIFWGIRMPTFRLRQP